MGSSVTITYIPAGLAADQAKDVTLVRERINSSAGGALTITGRENTINADSSYTIYAADSPENLSSNTVNFMGQSIAGSVVPDTPDA